MYIVVIKVCFTQILLTPQPPLLQLKTSPVGSVSQDGSQCDVTHFLCLGYFRNVMEETYSSKPMITHIIRLTIMLILLCNCWLVLILLLSSAWLICGSREVQPMRWGHHWPGPLSGPRPALVVLANWRSLQSMSRCWKTSCTLWSSLASGIHRRQLTCLKSHCSGLAP